MTESGKVDTEQNEEQELRALLSRVLKEPLEDMTRQLQNDLKEGLDVSKKNAIREVERSLESTKNSLEDLKDTIVEFPDEFRKEFFGIQQMIETRINDIKQSMHDELRNGFEIMKELNDKKLQQLYEEVDNKTNMAIKITSDANAQSSTSMKKLFIINISILLTMIVFFSKLFNS